MLLCLACCLVLSHTNTHTHRGRGWVVHAGLVIDAAPIAVVMKAAAKPEAILALWVSLSSLSCVSLWIMHAYSTRIRANIN